VWEQQSYIFHCYSVSELKYGFVSNAPKLGFFIAFVVIAPSYICSSKPAMATDKKETTASARSTDKAEVRKLIDDFFNALCKKDINGMMSHYLPGK
jgi:hypothetical protein